MALGLSAFVSLAVGVLAVWAITAESAHHASPAPAADCNSVIINLADCLEFVTNGSTVEKPKGTCCSGLKTVLKTNPECLCEGFKNSAQLGIVLNQTKALSLPTACKLSAPSISNCGLSGNPSPSPSPSHSHGPSISPLSPRTTAPTGSPAGSTVVQVAPSPSQGQSASSALVPAATILTAAALWVLF